MILTNSPMVRLDALQRGKQFVAADFYLPVYLAAQDNGDDNAKAQANAMMGSMDTAMPAIWWRLRISNCT